MSFIQTYLLVASSLVIIYIAYYTLTHRKASGAFAFFLITAAAIIWTLGSLFEINVTTMQSKIFWRNVQQIGVFSLPISSLYFSVIYTKHTKYMKFVAMAAIPSLLAVLLIFTNDLHHLVRSGYSLENSAVFGQTLVVHSTVLGTLLVAYNCFLPLVSVVILFYYAYKLSPNFRKQAYIIISCFLYTFTVAFIKITFLEQLGVYIQIAVLYVPAAVTMFISIFKQRTFALSPVARDKVFDVVSQGILVTDENGTIVDVNTYARDLLIKYLQIYQPIGVTLADISVNYPAISALVGRSDEERAEIHINSTENEAYFALHSCPLRQKKDKMLGYVIIINDITVQKRYEHDLKDKAEKDYLTRLLNQFGFEKALQRYIERGKLKDYSVLMIDIDRFKKINDTYGHAAGNMILCSLTDIINDIIRTEDIVGRMGGDEFVIVFPNISKDTALQIAERIRTSVQALAVEFEHQTIRYTISIGITDTQSGTDSFEEILRNADKALYQAKNLSRNGCVVYCEQQP